MSPPENRIVTARHLGVGTRPARQRSLRDHNLSLALRLVAGAPGPMSRAQIAAASGLTRATASTLVDALLAGGMLREVTLAGPARRGRPATGLELAPGGPAGLGLEIGVDYVAIAVVDLTGRVLYRADIEEDQRLLSPTESLRRAASAGAKALDAVAIQGVRVFGTAVALPGLVHEGKLLRAPNLDWHDVDVRRTLMRNRRLAALPLSLDNEANYAALGEVTATRQTFVHVSGEIGVGAGIVIDGELYRGSRGWAGEIGHTTVDRAGPPCRCGANGCLEAYAGQEAILKAARLQCSTASVAGQGQGRFLAERASRGDAKVLVALDEAARALGTVLAGVLNVLDISNVVLGGSYAPLAPWLLPGISRELTRRVLWSAWDAPCVLVAEQDAGAAVLGAARSVIASVLAEPIHWCVA